MLFVKLFSAILIVVVISRCDEQINGEYTSGINNQQGTNLERSLNHNDFSLTRESRSNQYYHDHHHHAHNHGPLNSYPNNGQSNINLNHQHDNLHYYGYNDYDDVNYNSIPLDFAKTINEYNVSDLLLNFVEDVPDFNERPFISSRFGEDSSGNETERSSSQIARPAKCMPELKTVKIAESKDPNVFYIPECTRVERCGGCCSHVLLSCQPVENDTVTFSVMKTEYTGNKKLKYVGKELILVERHTKCRCNCKVKREHCNSYQEYIEQECKCACKNIDEEKKCYKKNSKKLWNPDLCACQCREITPCSTGFQFDYNDCKCVQSQVKRRYILNERKEQPDTIE